MTLLHNKVPKSSITGRKNKSCLFCSSQPLENFWALYSLFRHFVARFARIIEGTFWSKLKGFVFLLHVNNFSTFVLSDQRCQRLHRAMNHPQLHDFFSAVCYIHICNWAGRCCSARPRRHCVLQVIESENKKDLH